MNKTDRFDVLVVYSQAIARSASDYGLTNTSPFPSWSRRANYNDAYIYFLKTCEKNNLTAAFTTSRDIIGAGKCKSYWIYKNYSWNKIDRICSSKLIFDKFSPINKDQEMKRKLLFSNSKIQPFNDKYIFKLFFDKYKTYSKLKQFSIPTLLINNASINGINKTINDLVKLTKKSGVVSDFTNDFVLKDRFGAGGNNIYKISNNNTKEIQKIIRDHSNISFIIQPFLKFNEGFSYDKFSGLIDIRIIYYKGKLVQTYIRTAKEKDFRCNEHQGGKLVYISKKDLPQNVLQLSKKVIKSLNKKSTLFALDFVVTNNKNVYLLEGNTGPGIDWNLSEKINELRAKLFIRKIVNGLSVNAKDLKEKKTNKIIWSYPVSVPQAPIVI